MSSEVRKPSRPPPPIPKPGTTKVVRALYRYEAQQSDELTFDEGDLLYILDMSNKDWWKARCGNKSGLIPSNYVEENTETVDSPLHEAAKRGNLTFLNECLENKVSVNSLDKAGSTALHWAAHGGHLDCMQSLLNKPNCEVNVQVETNSSQEKQSFVFGGELNKLGDTPLHAAAWRNHPEAVQMLLDKNARANIRNNEKKFAYELAKDPQSMHLIQQAAGVTRALSGDYGDEEDSD